MSDKYKEDVADPQLNINNLNEIFDIGDGDIDKQLEKVNEIRGELKTLQDDIPDVDNIIYDNIERAKKVLDIIEKNIFNGEYNARIIEVYTQLIKTITEAATSITGISYNQQLIDNKNRLLDIKEKELIIKGIATGTKGAENVNITNNNLIMTREDAMKMIRDAKKND